MKNSEYLELVNDLNDESFIDGLSIEYIEPFNFESNGYQSKISFMGIDLISDNNDERKWVNDNEQESLRVFIIRRAKIILTDIIARMDRI